MPQLRRRAAPMLVVALALALGGCGLNALRIQSAGDVAGKAKIATAAARTYLGVVQDTRQATNSDLIGLDAQCSPDLAYVRTHPDLAVYLKDTDTASGWLCLKERPANDDDPKNTSLQTYPSPLDLSPIDYSLEPDLKLLDALGSYGEALAKIVDEKDDPPSKDLLATYALAQSGEKLIATLWGKKPGLPAVSDVKVQSIAKFIDLIGQLAAEQDKVKRLRKIAASDGNAELIATLRDHINNWEVARRTDNNMRLVVAKIVFGQQMQRDPAPGASARQSALATYYARNKATFGAATLANAINAALDELAAADAHFRELLKEHPKLNAKDRAALARITRDRFTAAFDALTSVLTAFKGI